MLNYGDIGDKKGNFKDLDISVLKALDPKVLLAGLGFIAVGTLIICVGSFKHGADVYLQTETDALVSLDLMDAVDDVCGTFERR